MSAIAATAVKDETSPCLYPGDLPWSPLGSSAGRLGERTCVGGDGTHKNPILTWVEGHVIPSAFIAAGLLVALGLLLASLSGDDPADVAVPASTSTPADVATTDGPATADPDRPEFPIVDCQILLTDDEVDVALFEDGELSGPRGFFTFAQGETCRHAPDDDSGRYILIEPGDPADFEDTTQISGVFGEDVDGVGDAARWFDDDTDLGILSVGVDIEEASIVFRVHVSRSDLDRAQRLEKARELALEAIPRFPGTDPGPPEPLVDLCALVGDDQAEAVLADHRDAHPATREDILVTENFSDLVDLSEAGDAKCTKLILAEIYVETQQGSSSDFEPGAAMEGVAGESVDGVGDEAVWFPDVPYQGSFTAPHERGVLAVKAGDAMFRVVIAVPDTPPAVQLDIVRGFALGAIGQIPGVPAPVPEPEVTVFDEEPPQLEPQSLYDLVYDGVAEGEWSEGEGLAAALEWILDDTTGFVTGELADQSQTAVIASARAYATSGAEGAADIEALLDEIMSTLRQVAEQAAPPDAATGLLVSALPVGPLSAEVIDCPEGEEAGPIRVPLNLDPDKYKAFLYLPSKLGCDALDSPAFDGFEDAVVRYEKLGEMPTASIVIALHHTSFSVYDPQAGDCWVNIGEDQAGMNAVDLLHEAARETATCLIRHDLVRQLNASPSPWLEQGLAEYLGASVYSTANVEHKVLPELLSQQELWTTMTDRTWTNWAFFEYLHSRSDGMAVANLMRGLPQSGDLAEALAGVPEMGEVYHQFSQALSDSALPDIGGGNVPYGPDSWQVILSYPKTFDDELARFSTNRYRLEVPPNQYACEVTVTADGAQVSWRTGKPGVPGQWSSDVPETLEGDSVFLVTSVEDGAGFSFEVGKVGDNPECEDEEDDPIQDDGPSPIEPCDVCDPSTFYWKTITFGM